MCFKKMIVILGLGLALSANAETAYGPCEYGKVTLSSLTCFGPTVLNNTTIQGELKVMGPLNMQNSVVNNVSVKGILNSSHSIINGATSVYGPIFAQNTDFNGAVFSATNILKLSDSNVKGDVSIQSDDEIPMLQLDHTTINGNIDFTKKTGEVESNKNSSITGKISNGNKK